MAEAQIKQEARRKKSRSPNYPVIGLAEAIKGISKIYGKDYVNRMPKVVAATHLGYTGLNGASLGVISAIAKYGLLETVDDSYKVSQDGVAIIVDPPTSPDRQAAIRRAALCPLLFAELHELFGDHEVSEENLRAHLQKQGFIPRAASVAAQAYRETMELVSREGGMYDPSQVTDNSAPGGQMKEATAYVPPEPIPAGVQYARQKQAELATQDRELVRVPLKGGRLARVIFSGPQPTQKEIDKLIALLELTKDTFPENEPAEGEERAQ